MTPVTTMTPMTTMTPIDIIGDIHGQLPALQELGRSMGYAVDAGWTHPADRALIFVGDLVDRGAYSLEVGELVMDLVGRGRALCLMGNHEYNLVAHQLGVAGYAKAKDSNERTIEHIQQHPDRWRPVLRFFAGLPMSLELPDLRIVHACWHQPSLNAVDEILAKPARPPSLPDQGPLAALCPYVRHFSPFTATGLMPDLPGKPGPKIDPPHEVLMKISMA